MYADGLNQNIQKAFMKIEGNRESLINSIRDQKEDFKERLSDLDKYYSEQMEDLSTNIEQVRVMARDSVNAKEKELTDLMNKQIKII